MRWLAAGGRIVSLLKPHYELDEPEKRSRLRQGMLSPADARTVVRGVIEQMPALGVRVEAVAESPITGAKSARRSRGGGNREYLVLAVETPAKSR